MSSKSTIINTKQPCIGCSLRSQKSSNICHQRSKSGLICNNCGSFLCKECAKKLYSLIKAKLTSIHEDCHPYINSLKQYCESKNEKGKCHQQNYTGNCCFIRQLRDKEKILEKYRYEMLEFFYKSSRKRKKSTVPSTFNSIGGDMCLPEFGVIVETDFKAIDVLGLGGEMLTDGSSLKQRYHFVIDTLNASELESAGVQPMFQMPSHWIRVDEKIRMNYPHSATPRPFQCSIFFVKKIKDADMREKGSNIISTNDASSFFYFSPRTVHKSDITIVVGYEEGEDAASILLLRYHTHLKVPHMKDETKLNLFNDITKLLSNRGLERRRSGGSSGILRYSSSI